MFSYLMLCERRSKVESRISIVGTAEPMYLYINDKTSPDCQAVLPRRSRDGHSLCPVIATATFISYF